MTRVPLSLGAALLVALMGVMAFAQERAVEVHKPRHRPAAELVSIAQLALGEEGTAVADPGTNSLVLIGTRAAVDRAIALVQAQDQPRRTVILHWSARDQAELEAAGIRVEWSARVGSVRVGTILFPEDRLDVRAEILRTERERRLEGTLRLLDGETGRIGQGRSVPVTTRDRYGRASTAFVEAEQGFQATVRVLGNGKVRVEIQPSDDRVSSRGFTRFAGASTVVEVVPGDLVLLGSIGEWRDEGQRGSRILSTNQRSEERVMLLRVEVE